ncbi:Uncharacterized protein FWK35_00008439 [Aphis craccivora]|uniref:Uncharacterized protein n=1 Tax=Aphis craccivora TaxID=307492 RepID=A0A6G0Z300_APHCR|nr:Uncharacterized protein FWK35_00008439 [Aphis craccivora]
MRTQTVVTIFRRRRAAALVYIILSYIKANTIIINGMRNGRRHRTCRKKKNYNKYINVFFFLPNRVSQSDHVCAAAKIRRRRGGGVITRFGASLNLTSSSSSVSRSRRSASSTADDRTDRQAALGRKLGNRRVTTAAG